LWRLRHNTEQDFVICRALVELFSNPVIAKALAFRGVTALYKLYIKPPARYSEDIDLVQMTAEPAGPVMEAIRSVLAPWLGTPRWKQTAGRVTFVYRFAAEDTPRIAMRLKVEANTREHFAEAAENIVRLKKPAMAEAAETALAGKGWLPSLLAATAA
jgi:predicted nucleotidyltransferase component of viral defense system